MPDKQNSPIQISNYVNYIWIWIDYLSLIIQAKQLKFETLMCNFRRHAKFSKTWDI